MIAPIDVTPIRIETDRLVLRSWRETDLEDFYEYASVPGVGEMAGWAHHKSMDESRRILEIFIEEKKTFAISLKENGKVIGSLGLEEREEKMDLPEDSKGREIGYALSKDYWGQGLMPEACKAVIQYCFEKLDLDWLTCCHYIRNNQSRRVIEKCGFAYVKDIDNVSRMRTHEMSKIYVLHNEYKVFKQMTAPVDVTGVKIETDRLILRPIGQEDLLELHEIRTTPEIAKFDGWEVSKILEDTQEALDHAVASKEDLAVVLKETGKLIGTFALQARNWKQYPVDRRLKGREFGFDLNKQYWGRGLMPEALNAVTEYCFNVLSYDFVTCGHFLENVQSARVIEKCGYTFLFEDAHTMPTGKEEMIRTYIRYNPDKENHNV